MQQLLSRPEIQSAVIPFTVALIAYFGLRKFTASAAIWALLAAFVAAVALINGAGFTPLTGTRKIILLVAASLPAAVLLSRIMTGHKMQRAAMVAISGLALAWVFWSVVARWQTGSIALFAAGSAGLVLALTISFDRISSNTAQLQGAGLALLLGVGLSAAAGASALLGQLAIALAAGCGGAFLGWVIGAPASRGNATGQPITALPYVLAPVLLGIAAVIFARLPWYALIPLAAIPLTVSLVPLKHDSRLLRALLATLPGLAIAIAVALLVWQAGGSDSGY